MRGRNRPTLDFIIILSGQLDLRPEDGGDDRCNFSDGSDGLNDATYAVQTLLDDPRVPPR
jgi:hypothetical protein